jgi:predicted nucleic acid-binding protein
MARSPDAYVDTSAFVAFADRSDSHHVLFRRAFAAPPSLLTTSLVVAEGHAWFLRRHDRTRALQFLAMIEEMSPLSIIVVGAQEVAAATEVLRRFSDQDLTLTDALGLHVMRDRKIRSCWSTDHHLGLGGVLLLIDQR